MGVATGCHDAKATPKLEEIKCPQCGEMMEVFTKEGKATADEKCDKCGYIITAGTAILNNH